MIRRAGPATIGMIVTGLSFVAVALALKAGRPELTGYVELAKGDGVEIAGDVLVLKDFSVPKYPSGRARQYESSVHIIDKAAKRAAHDVISVNHPLVWKGRWIYQNSFDADTEAATILMVKEDPYLVLAAVGGLLVVIGALLGIFAFSTDEPFITGGRARRILSVFAAVAVLALPIFIVGRSVLKPEPVPALQSPLLAPHVASYMISYLIMIFAAFGIGRRFMGIGFFFMALGLVLGALWGKICWGDYWQYDPKEMWSFFTFLTYLAYFVLRRWPITERIFRWAGLAMVLFTLTYVNFSRLFVGIHSYAQ